ncbi:MAG: DUF6364 family protein [Bacteroidota bacterium]
MNNKLTLSINQIVIEEAKKYAKSSGKSLSNIVEEYLKSLTLKEETDKKKASLKIVRELKGSVKLPEDFTSYKEILQDALLEKYLSK